jgi:hypothetical protein
MTYNLGIIVNGHWRLGIGDPTIIGWLITALYLTSTILCGIYAWRSDRTSPVNHQHRIFWWALSVFLLLMAFNKQLDLQSWLMLEGRKMASTQGWYSQRKIVKVWFALGIAAFSLILITWLGWSLRLALKNCGLAIFGLILLFTFIVIRAGSFHLKIFNWDQKVYIHNILEISSILCIGTSALINILRDKKQTT